VFSNGTSSSARRGVDLSVTTGDYFEQSSNFLLAFTSVRCPAERKPSIYKSVMDILKGTGGVALSAPIEIRRKENKMGHLKYQKIVLSLPLSENLKSQISNLHLRLNVIMTE
jgi:hypothetical protein